MECPKLKFKGKGTKEKKKAFKATWDDLSNLKKEEENQEVANLCFITLEDKELPFTSNSSYCDDDEFNCDDDDNDNYNERDRKSTRLNSSHSGESRMPSSA